MDTDEAYVMYYEVREGRQAEAVRMFERHAIALSKEPGVVFGAIVYRLEECDCVCANVLVGSDRGPEYRNAIEFGQEWL